MTRTITRQPTSRTQRSTSSKPAPHSFVYFGARYAVFSTRKKAQKLVEEAPKLDA